MWFQLLQKIVRFLDPKLDKYREKRPTPKKPAPFAPTSIEDFIGVIRRTPESVLTPTDRARIAAIMSYDDKIISDLMHPRSQMVFVKKSEVLGPLTLDKLYKSGLTDFPVIDAKDHVTGILHTESLNNLSVRDSATADKLSDSLVVYLHTTDPLSRISDELKRTGSNFFLVRDPSDRLVGCVSVTDLLDYLLG